MKILNLSEANSYLSEIGMRIGEWNNIAFKREPQSSRWLNHKCPDNAAELWAYSQHVAGWVRDGRWKMLQIDNSTNMDIVEVNSIYSLLGVNKVGVEKSKLNSVIFCYGDDAEENLRINLTVANLVFYFLLFELHAYIVSSESALFGHLSIHDGYSYFHAEEAGIKSAKSLLEKFEMNKRMSPDWVIARIIKHQEDF